MSFATRGTLTNNRIRPVTIELMRAFDDAFDSAMMDAQMGPLPEGDWDRRLRQVRTEIMQTYALDSVTYEREMRSRVSVAWMMRNNILAMLDV